MRLYLAADGIRHAEVVGWTGQAVAAPRSRIEALKDWRGEVGRPGAYFLFGETDAGVALAYIGETDDVLDRLKSHVSRKEFWTEFVAVTSKDSLLTKAHVEYLEYRFVDLAKTAGRYQLDNGNTPKEPPLPRGDRDAMGDFVDHSRVLLGVLGHRILDPIPVRPVSTQPSSAEDEIFTFSVRDVRATGFRTDDGFVVRAGSNAVREDAPGLQPNYVALRARLKKEEVLVPDGDLFRFARDFVFNSPSGAATAIAGAHRNGRKDWVLASGKSLAEVESAEADSLDS